MNNTVKLNSIHFCGENLSDLWGNITAVETEFISYVTAGNIRSKSEYDYTVGELGNATDTVTYTYDSTWSDQLVSYDGTSITYDAQGNPLNWRDGLTFTWSGRELSSIVEDTKVYSYEYNADGIRTKTIITDTEDADYLSEYEYVLDDNNNVIAVYKDGAAYGEYYFDESGSPIGYRYNNTDYWYTKNLQGDITRVESEDGELYVEYDYDAWGNATVDYSTSQARLAIERVNIYTYRGYIYDRDTGLYYLQSRYYDPAVGRFINADDTSYLGASGTILGYNLYAYCENNPVCYTDKRGLNRSIWSLKHDWAGIKILQWYLTGNGKTRILNDDKWANYMKNNSKLRAKVKNFIKNYKVFAKNKLSSNPNANIINITTSMEIDNGEDIIGYQYLHGTNSKVGGFGIQLTVIKENNGNYSFIASYTWNDIIDPNPYYTSDVVKSRFASIITFGRARSYIIRISWFDISVMNKSGKWIKGWLSW